jgi:hypothetical protein
MGSGGNGHAIGKTAQLTTGVVTTAPGVVKTPAGAVAAYGDTTAG